MLVSLSTFFEVDNDYLDKLSSKSRSDLAIKGFVTCGPFSEQLK